MPKIGLRVVEHTSREVSLDKWPKAVVRQKILTLLDIDIGNERKDSLILAKDVKNVEHDKCKIAKNHLNKIIIPKT